MAKERVRRDGVLVVGDGPDDQRAARAAGVRFAAIVAENRIASDRHFGLRDLRRLVPRVDALNGGRRIRWR